MAVKPAPADDVLVVRPALRLRGSPRLPGDKSISHRALLFALLAEGESRITAAGDGEDVRSTARLVGALGANVERVAERDGRVDYRIVSPGGDALLMRPLLLHASGKTVSERRRRILHIEYAGFTLPEGLAWNPAA